MDSPWRSELYLPSTACETTPFEKLEDEYLIEEIQSLSKYTKELKVFPYDPETWLNRSHSLLLLGYPDLALGDIYKARLLVEAALEKCPVLGKWNHPSTLTSLSELVDHALRGSSTFGEKAILTFGIKMYFQHVTNPEYSKWRATVATPTLLQKRAIGMLKRLEIQIWAELMDGLLASNASQDYINLSKEALIKFDNDPLFVSENLNAEAWFAQRETILQAQVDEGGMSLSTMSMTLMNGGFYPVPYPWMTEDLLSRDDEFLATIQDEFKEASSNSTVLRSTIRDVVLEDGVEVQTEIDVLGVFASRDIKAYETTLVDETIFCILNTTTRCPTCCGPIPHSKRPITNGCCQNPYCSTTCAQTALEDYHRPECIKAASLERYYREASSATDTTDFSVEHLLFLRIICNIITEKAPHPLKSSICQRLTPSYSNENLTIFNWIDHIVKPTNILLTLGIDVFKSLEYDTWVLQTMRHRMQNNKHGVLYSHKGQFEDDAHNDENKIVGTSVSPLYSMHNHSCDPNVSWEFCSGEGYDNSETVDGRCSTLRMFANRDIKKGEEMCITYILPLDISRAERNERLLSWLGGECRCSRCEGEKDEEVSEEEDDEERED